MTAGKLTERVAFDLEQVVPDGLGGQSRSWSEVFECWAEFRYTRGREAEQAGGWTGSAVFKVKVRSSSETRELTAAHRLRDVARGVAYNIRQVDGVTDRAWVWLVVESGVAI